MKKFLILALTFVCMLSLLALTSCDNDATTTTDNGGTTTTDSDDTTTKRDPGPTLPDVPENAILKKIDSYSPIINMAAISEKLNNFSSLSGFGNTDTADEWTNVINMDFGTSGYIKINQAGIYHITGTTPGGYIEVNVKGKATDFTVMPEVIIILDNVNITAMPDMASMPPIYSEDCNLTIVLAKNSQNVLTDTDLNKDKGAIYAKSGTLTIGGEGKLTINAYAKSGIYNTKSITIDGGVYDIAANYHGICAKNDITINSGDFKITSTKSGLKSGDYDDTTTPVTDVAGNTTINGGKFDITAITNGINAHGAVSISKAGLKMVCANGIDAFTNVTVSTGSALIIESTKDAIKTPGDVTISGSAKIVSGEDGISGNNVTINSDGIVYIKTSGNFEQDNTNGDFVRDKSGTYIKVKPEDFAQYNRYAITNNCRGIKADGTFTMSKGYLAIDSAQDAINAVSASFTAGTTVLASLEDGVSADQAVTVGNNVTLNVMNAYKGIKSATVTVSGANMVVASISDSINAPAVTINSGRIYLFDCVDVGATGTFTVNGGTFISIADTKNPKVPTSESQTVISGTVSDPVGFVYGKHIKVCGDGVEAVFAITKNYSDKLSVVITSPLADANGSYEVQLGTYLGGSPSSYVFAPGGTFTTEKTANITQQ